MQSNWNNNTGTFQSFDQQQANYATTDVPDCVDHSQELQQSHTDVKVPMGSPENQMEQPDQYCEKNVQQNTLSNDNANEIKTKVEDNENCCVKCRDASKINNQFHIVMPQDTNNLKVIQLIDGEVYETPIQSTSWTDTIRMPQSNGLPRLLYLANGLNAICKCLQNEEQPKSKEILKVFFNSIKAIGAEIQVINIE